ncbi:MAG: hypothetical protein KDK70_16360, partial [Myxococcales bacterium]|nr:hypothetical protein [Myxococcales bacterium]
MVLWPLWLALAMGAPALVRPSLASPGHEVVVEAEDSAEAAALGAVPDGWAPRVLRRTADGAVVVRGPARPVAPLVDARPPSLQARDAIDRGA